MLLYMRNKLQNNLFKNKGLIGMKVPNLSELTLEEKIAQLLMMAQWRLPTDVDQIKEVFKRNQFGSLWYFGCMKTEVVNIGENNWKRGPIAQSKKDINVMKSQVRIPMFVASDCESGAGTMFSDATRIPSALSVGAANDEELTYELSKSVALEMKAAGINWRWFPVVDLPNRLSAISTGRSYSDDADKLVRLATATIRGTEDAGLISTVKHFPGCDPYEIRDGHLVTPTVNISFEEWEKKPGAVFQRMIDAGVMSIMTTHTCFPAVDDTKVKGRYVPATLSKKITTDLLRNKMGFEGLIITDGLNMAGLTSLYSWEEILINAINAGNDVLLGVTSDDLPIVKKAVLDGKIPMERIDESCKRILDMKARIGLFDENDPEIDIDAVREHTKELARQISEKSVSLLYDKNELLPLDKNKINNIGIIWSSHATDPEEKLATLIEELKARNIECEIVSGFVPAETIERFSTEKDLILYIGLVAPHCPMGSPFLSGAVAQTYNVAFSFGKEKSIGVSVGYPYLHIDIMTGADTFINCYSPDEENQKALVKALFGEIEFKGSSPIDIEPKLRLVYC